MTYRWRSELRMICSRRGTVCREVSMQQRLSVLGQNSWSDWRPFCLFLARLSFQKHKLNMEDTREEASGPEAPAQVIQPWTISKSSLIRKLRQHLISCKYIIIIIIISHSCNIRVRIYIIYIIIIFCFRYLCIYLCICNYFCIYLSICIYLYIHIFAFI